MAVADLWRQVDRESGFDLSGTEYSLRLPGFGFVSGSSTHADRLGIIRRVFRDYGLIIDTHTADGLKVGMEHREQGVPLVCLETAQPAKFAATIREALGRDPDVASGFETLEGKPQRVDVIEVDVEAVKSYIARRCGR
jgi:threonine synthase